MVTPITSSLPGMVTCICQKRLVPFHGKCGLPSSRPRPSAVLSRPKAQALDETGRSCGPRSAAARVTSGTWLAAAFAEGGRAPSIASANKPMPSWMAVISPLRRYSASVIGSTQALPAQAAGSWPAWSAR